MKRTGRLRSLITSDFAYDEVATQRKAQGINEVITLWQGWATALPDSKCTSNALVSDPEGADRPDGQADRDQGMQRGSVEGGEGQSTAAILRYEHAAPAARRHRLRQLPIIRLRARVRAHSGGPELRAPARRQ